MRLAGLSLSRIGLCSNDNPLGWQKWVDDEEQSAEKLARCKALFDAGSISGVYLVGGCGKLKKLMPCGEYDNGDDCMTCWAGHTQGGLNKIVYDFAEMVPVTVSIGLPHDFDGLDLFRRECESLEDVSFVLDATGGNTSIRVRACQLACPGVRLESRPLPGHEVHPEDTLYVTMASRAIRIMQERGSLDGDIVFFNNGNDRNHWNEALALLFESRGVTVVQPLETIA